MQKHTDLPEEFGALGVEVPILKALRQIGFEKPTDIQRELIPRIIAGENILGQARTGTGKTAAFGIPTLQRLDPTGRLQALCLAPTRELAVQVTGELRRLAQYTALRCVAVYGGQKIQTQVHQLGRKPHFVIGTPGRVTSAASSTTSRTARIRSSYRPRSTRRSAPWPASTRPSSRRSTSRVISSPSARSPSTTSRRRGTTRTAC